MGDKNKYKIIIFGKNIYREYSLSETDSNYIKIGTAKGSQVRFKKENFFDEFELNLEKNNYGWELVCNDTVYFTTDGIIKFDNKELQHGDEVTVKYKNFNEEVFKINFLIDFDSEEREYNREIDISNIRDISIGGNDQDNIYIKDEFLKQGNFNISKKQESYYIKDNNTRYGIYKNTEKVTKETKIENCDFIITMGYYFYFKEGKLYTEINKDMIISGIKYIDNKPKNKFKYPKFNRSARIKYILPDNEIEILPPEKLPKAPKNKLIFTLIPAVVMLIVTVILRGAMGGGGSFVIFSVVTMSMGIVMSIVTAISTKKEYEGEVKERRIAYLKYLEDKKNQISQLRSKELDILNKKYISLDKSVENINYFSKELFDRSIKDDDFLEITLGYGKREANCKIKITAQEFKDSLDDLIDIPEKIELENKYIDNAPIVVKLSENSSIGIVGKHNLLCDFSTQISLEIISRHFQKDVSLFYVIDEEDKESFSWLRWVKHVQNEELSIRNLVCDEESKNLLFEYLYIELLKREELHKANNDQKFISFVVCVLDNKGLKNHPISRFIEDGNNFNITFIFFEESEELLPMGCSKIIRLQSKTEGELIECENGELIYKFTRKPVESLVLEDIALKLAPIFIDDVSLENQLTKNISLFKLLGVSTVDEIDIESRWNESQTYKSMAAPLGVKIKDEVVCLDLNEKKHGPHGLVAGTTGSGKSEILQSYILSMSTLFHPYEVSFVIIDFKGGGMVNQFKNLPHLVGSITNIDGREITRSLLSIKAELKKRQAIFAETNVNHIDAYIKKFKSGEATIPLPHLILIVDEFAELKSDQPEFMKELISAARIGRSLGVHLILATQKPSGVIDDQIWSNSKFKLCLKVQNQGDSNEVLKSPLAAEIKEPGRAYLQVGNNEIFELFQSAYSGAPAVEDDMGSTKEFLLNEVSLWGKRKTVFKQEKRKNTEGSKTQLEVVVEYINDYCREKDILKLPGICLPPLPEVILINDAKYIEKDGVCTEVAIGLYDDPTRQLQDSVMLNISEGNVFILGSSQFGKTSLLQTIIRGLADKYTPNEVNIYILDFASMILKSFQDLNHVGGIITSSEDEKLKTFMKMMIKEIEFRKEKLSKLGLSSFISYKEAGYSDMPQIVIMLDNMTAFKELYQERDEELLNICREGLAIGITTIIANSQTNGIGYKYMANFSNRISLYCNDSSEYGSVFDKCRMQPKNVPGRALISIDKEIYEYQTYLAFTGEKEIDRVKNMKQFIKEIKEKYRGEFARQIPEIPQILDMNFINKNYSNKSLKPYTVPIGLDYENIELETIDLSKENVIVTMGEEGKGKSNFIENIVQNLQRNILSQPVQGYVVDNMDKKLKFMKEYGFVEKYTSIYSELESCIEIIYEELEDRNERVTEFGSEILKNEPLLLVINNNREALASLASNKLLSEKYKKMISQYKNLKVCFIFADIENIAQGYMAPELIKNLKENKNVFFFDDIAECKFYDLPMNVARNFKKSLSIGDCYWFKGGDIKKIKTILRT